MLIVADEAAATAATTGHGIACVTLAGVVSRPGSVSGGWLGPGPGPNEALLAKKLDAELAEATEAAASVEAASWLAVLEHAQALEAELTSAAAAGRVVEAALQSAVARVQELAKEVSRASEGGAQLRADLGAAEEELRRCCQAVTLAKQQQAEAQGQRQPGGTHGGGCLENELLRAGEKLRAIQAGHREAIAAAEDAEAKLEEVECLLGPTHHHSAQAAKPGHVSRSASAGSGRVAAVAKEDPIEDVLSRCVSAGKEAELAQAEQGLLGLRAELQEALREDERIKRCGDVCGEGRASGNTLTGLPSDDDEQRASPLMLSALFPFFREAADAKQKALRLQQEQKEAQLRAKKLKHAVAEVGARLNTSRASRNQAQAAAVKLASSFPHASGSVQGVALGAGSGRVGRGGEEESAGDTATSNGAKDLTKQLEKMQSERLKLQAVQVEGSRRLGYFIFV